MYTAVTCGKRRNNPLAYPNSKTKRGSSREGTSINQGSGKVGEVPVYHSGDSALSEPRNPLNSEGSTVVWPSTGGGAFVSDPRGSFPFGATKCVRHTE